MENYTLGLLIHAKISWKMPCEFSPPWITYQACLNLNTINRKLVKDINSFIIAHMYIYYKPPKVRKEPLYTQKYDELYVAIQKYMNYRLGRYYTTIY